MSKYLDGMRDVENVMTEYGYELQHLSTAFMATGNEHMGELLAHIGNQLHINQKKLSNTVAEEINEHLALTQKSLGDTLALVFENSTSQLKENEQDTNGC